MAKAHSNSFLKEPLNQDKEMFFDHLESLNNGKTSLSWQQIHPTQRDCF